MAQAVSNADIARIFTHYSALLEIEGANPFRVRAYQNVARLIQGLPKSVPDMLAEGADLTELEGIGEDLAGKIGEIVNTRRLGVLEEIEKRMPAALVGLTGLPGLGPKRVKLLYDRLHTRSPRISSERRVPAAFGKYPASDPKQRRRYCRRSPPAGHARRGSAGSRPSRSRSRSSKSWRPCRASGPRS